MWVLLAFFYLVTILSRVEGHGMLVIPAMWTDFEANADTSDSNGLSTSWSNGCSNKEYPLKPFKQSDECPADMGSCGNCPLGPKCESLKKWMAYPNCNYKFFNSGVTWKTRKNIKKAEKDQPDQTIQRMPKEMFIQQEDKCSDCCYSNENGCFSGPAKRAEDCSNYYTGKSNATSYRMYRQKCGNPWWQPGLTEIYSPCGISGGRPKGDKYYPGDTLKRTHGFAKKAEKLNYPQMPTTIWKIGDEVEVLWNVMANHGGGYQYRICKLPSSGISGVTEECFQKTPLEFVGDTREIRPEFVADWTTEQVLQSNVGTWPKGSMWRKNHYFPPTNDPPAGMMQKVKYIGRGQIKDKVKVPDVEVGTYVVSWRWDCEASPQVWSGCSNVEIVA